jgi:hypothetical protein
MAAPTQRTHLSTGRNDEDDPHVLSTPQRLSRNDLVDGQKEIVGPGAVLVANFGPASLAENLIDSMSGDVSHELRCLTVDLHAVATDAQNLRRLDPVIPAAIQAATWHHFLPL